VVDDPRQLVGMQTEVQGVQHRTHRGDGEVRLVMGLGVELQCRDNVARAYAKVMQGVGKLTGASANLREARRRRAIAGEGHDGRVTEHSGAMFKDHADREIHISHGGNGVRHVRHGRGTQ
jgi:hypothetical protein